MRLEAGAASEGSLVDQSKWVIPQTISANRNVILGYGIHNNKLFKLSSYQGSDLYNLSENLNRQ